jgi:hypothetical protein
MNGLRSALYAALLFSFAGIIYGVLEHGPLMHEGSVWFFEFLNKRQFYYDTSYFRQSDVLFQLPAWLWVHIFPDDITGTIKLLEYTYGLHGILSIVCTLLILVNRKREDLAPFFLLAWAVSSLSTLPFAVGIVPGALSAFWPLFALILFRRNSKLEFAVILILQFFLAFSHESVFLLFLMLFAVGWWRYQKRICRTKEELVLIFMNLAGFSWYVLRYLIIKSEFSVPGVAVPGIVSRTFIAPLLYDVDPYRKFVIAVTVLLIAGAIFFRKYSKYQKKISVVLSLVILTLAFIFLPKAFFGWAGILWVRDARTSAIPLAVIIAACILLFSQKPTNWMTTTFGKTFQALVFCMLVLATIFDIRVTRIWRDGLASMEQLMEKPGCNFVRDETSQISLGGTTLRHYTSLIIQRSWKPDRVLFYGAGRKYDHNVCETYDADFVTYDTRRFPGRTPLIYFDFSKIIATLPPLNRQAREEALKL